MTERLTDEQLEERIALYVVNGLKGCEEWQIANELLSLRTYTRAYTRTIDKALVEEQRVNAALRAERAKPTQSDEEVGAAISCYGENRFCEPECYCAVHTKTCVSLLASIRAEGSAERAKLEEARRIDAIDQHEITIVEAGVEAYTTGKGGSLSKMTRAWRKMAAIALAQPAESGATPLGGRGPDSPRGRIPIGAKP